MPWFMLSLLLGQLAYVLARSYSPKGDFEREWLGRAGDWFIIAALAWIIVSSLVLLGSYLIGLVEVGACTYCERMAPRGRWDRHSVGHRHRVARQEQQHPGARTGNQPY
jgi:hypothetical protein